MDDAALLPLEGAAAPAAASPSIRVGDVAEGWARRTGPAGRIDPAPAEILPPVPLSALEFTDLYFPAAPPVRAILRGVPSAPSERGSGDNRSKVVAVPEAATADLRTLHAAVCARGEREAEFFIDHDGVRYRVARIADLNGVCFALRRGKIVVPRFRELGINGRIGQQLGAIGGRHGLVLFSGATGSGKTTTACSLLQEYLHHYGDVGVAIEDPPELPLAGPHGDFGHCFQIAVENGDFSRHVAASMRYNPRYILLGEVRTPQDASQALRAAINGHVVLTTVHGGSVQEAIQSMLKLVAGYENLDLARATLADGLAAVIHQELIDVGGGRKRLRVSSLFPGGGAAQAVRANIRQGKIEQLETEIQRQRSLIMAGKPPVEG